MNIQFILVQLLGLIPSLIVLTSLQTNNRKRMLLLQVGCCFMWGIHYALLGAFTSVATNVVGLLKIYLCYNNDKPWANKKRWLVLLIVLYIACAVFTWDGFYCILPVVSMILSTIGLWSKDMRKTRMLFLLNSPPLLVYNIITGSYSCAIIEAFAFVSFVVAIFRFDICKKEKEEIAD